ncbi:MAG: hypothetical protein HY286_02640 [Planctomycetes bacterium]|nr:hypothetical protein [Planctomycetota bacterium]
MPRFWILTLAAALSGVAAVFYEVLWIRRLGESLGGTTLAICWILTIFFAGQGIGGRIFGKIADRAGGSLRVFCALEIALGLCGIVFIQISNAFEAIGMPTATAIFLMIPSLCMGGTVPVLTRHFARSSSEFAPKLSILYAASTAGAAAGAFAVTFIIIPAFGVFVSFVIAAALNATAAALGFLQFRAAEPFPDAAAAPEERKSAVILVCAAISGFLTIALEHAYTRALSGRFLGTVYSFATVLGVYLVSLAAGALCLRAFAAARRTGARTLVFVAIFTAIAIHISGIQLSLEPKLERAPTSALARQFDELLFAFKILALPTLLAGLQLPMLASLAAGDPRAFGASLGNIYIVNALGCVAAAWVTPYLLFPTLGLANTFIVAGAASCAIAILLLIKSGLSVPIFIIVSASMSIAACAAYILNDAEIRPIYLKYDSAYALERGLRPWSFRETIQMYVEGPSASVAIVRGDEGDAIFVNHQYRLGSTASAFAQSRQSLIPALLHGGAKSALFLGVGTGNSAGAMMQYGVAHNDLVEILPEIRATFPYFSQFNGRLDLLQSRGFAARTFFEDARRFVRESRDAYDLIQGDFFVPWHAGEGSLYTKEHFEAIRARLATGGVFWQWLPLYQLDEAGFKTIAKTFLDVFPNASAWWLYYNTQQPAIGLAGSLAPELYDPAALKLRIDDKTRKQLLESAGLLDARILLGSRICGAKELAAFSKNAEIETRDRPRIEFQTPRNLDAIQFTKSTALVEQLLQLSTPPSAPDFRPGMPEEIIRTIANYHNAVRSLMRGLNVLSSAEPQAKAKAAESFEAAVRLAPDWDFPRWNLKNIKK